MNTKCPLSKAPAEVCQCMECAVAGIGDVVGPEYVFRTTHLMTKGDKACRWVVEKKK